ncbi:MAG: TonB-dependent receptor [candidate division KSB1 bacterium]|nr:TonB-dependent receptor [candidate division KSB1 bacterium]
MNQLNRVIALILLLTIAMTGPLWSGTTGKIAGTVIDKKTGEPLPGANVVIVGTTLGAATDINGKYTILYVSPGLYDVQVSMIGYAKVMAKEVRVLIDQTARVDFALEMEVIEGEVVTVVAERTIIKPDVATSVVAMSDKEVEELPINNVVSAIGLQAGIRGGWSGPLGGAARPSYVNNYIRGRVSVQGGLSIRGGEGDNILVEMDGVTLRDPRNNEPMTRMPLSSVKEISVERGGFNAEYGQVRSGIVNIVTKEGSKQGYSGSLQFRYSPPAPKYWRGPGILDVHDPYSFVLRPFFDPDVCWTGTDNGAWDEYTRSQYPSFMGWNEVSRILCSDNDPNNDLTPLGAQRVFEYETRKKQPNDQPDYDIDAGFGGPIPFVSEALGNLRFYTSYRTNREMLLFPLTRPDYRDYDWNFQVNSDITPSMRLRFSGLIGKQFTLRHNWDATGIYFYPRTPSEIASVASSIYSPTDLVMLFSDYNFCLADIGHRSFAAKLTHTISPKTFYEVSLEHFRRDYNVRPRALRDTSKVFEIIPGFYEDSNPFGYWPTQARGIIVSGGQHVSKARDFTVVNSTTLKADFTSQVNFQNLVKAGIELDYNDLDFDYGTIMSGGQAAEKYANRVQMRVFPIRGATYIQDKLEVKEFTANLGLRLDYSNSNVNWWRVDPYSKSFFAPTAKELAAGITYPKEKSKAQWQLSPRLGIAHPITENSKLFFNYGHFKQLPQYESLFRVERNDVYAVTSFGNPNLILAKTISYELGFDYLLPQELLLQLAAFYNDISDQQDFTNYQSLAYGFSYTYSTSNNYQDTRGFELTLRKSAGRWWSGFANYTYLVNTTGHFGSSRRFDDKTEQKKWDEATVNLYQDRPIPQPYARVNLNLYTPEDFGPAVVNHHILGGFGLNLILDWQAGYWTTWNPGNLPYVAYNVKAVDFFNTYLRLDKTLTFGKFRMQLFVDINNVLNTRRLWNTGDYNYLASLHLPKSDVYTNIPGNDKVGDYRKPGVEFQPMEHVTRLDPRGGNERAWYYEDASGKYFEWVNNQWVEVDKQRLDKALKDKAYIDMPNASTFWFLDPRKIYFGLRVSFDFSK